MALSISVKPHIIHPYVKIATNVRIELAKDWRAEANNAFAVERAYCFRWGFKRDARQKSGFVYEVYQVQTPDSIIGQTPYSIDDLWCPPGLGVLHTHTATTCDSSSTPWGVVYQDCILGGKDAYDCQPSETDQESQDNSFDNKEGAPFELIQCGQDEVFPFWPD